MKNSRQSPVGSRLNVAGSGRHETGSLELVTLLLIAAAHAMWLLATTVLASSSLLIAIPALACIVALYSSLQHEVIHGHPTRWQWLNEALVFPALTVLIPYQRFRDDHLAHHRDETLTDPYDDPESNYLSPTQWDAQCVMRRAVLNFNNTLLGRLIVGPLIGQVRFMLADGRMIARGDRTVNRGWVHHFVGLVPVALWLVFVADIPIWAFAVGTYGGLSIVKIRTYLEHQAHARACARTVVIEDRGPLAFLFLNNNFHVVHHMHPKVPWYRLPGLYHANRDRYLKRNDGYRFASYGDVFRKHLWRAKDPVAHPLMEREG